VRVAAVLPCNHPMTVTTETETPKSTAVQPMSVCILDDDWDTAETLQEKMQEFGFSSYGTSDPRDALEHIGSGRSRVIICDLNRSEDNGIGFVQQALQRDPGVFVILTTSSHSMDSAMHAIRSGAYDCLPKPIDGARLKRTLDDLAEQFQRRRRIQKLEQQLLSDLEFHGIIGRSAAMLEVFDMVRKIAQHYTNVLLTGPTGTGKELLASAIHQMSPVSGQRFAVCNCSALVDTLLESQLFGHMRGSFTGATDTRAGLFEYANGGTVFLDEIGETSAAMQAKLLRVIQNREIQRVGSPEVRHVEVRIVAATNRDLRAEVAAGRFREDLLYRLSTIQIRVPSLTERLEDIPLLVAFFIKKYNGAYHKEIRGLTHRAKTLVMQHGWPGNVRELENVIAGAGLLAAGELIDVDDLPSHIRQPTGPIGTGENWRPLPLEEVRSKHIQKVLEACGGNRVRAAQLLGIGRTSLYRYLKRESQGSVHAA
jgi:two-component system response regulator HydG